MNTSLFSGGPGILGSVTSKSVTPREILHIQQSFSMKHPKLPESRNRKGTT